MSMGRGTRSGWVSKWRANGVDVHLEGGEEGRSYACLRIGYPLGYRSALNQWHMSPFEINKQQRSSGIFLTHVMSCEDVQSEIPPT
jgi:hypothetical protein